MDFFTIGVYNSTENDFFERLIQNKVDTFCDIRQRRGVRGAKYSFVNSSRLQERLKLIGIKYIYIKELAPTTEVRSLQKEADIKNNEKKSERRQLGEVFIEKYTSEVLNKFNFSSFINFLNANNASRVVFFCVEEHSTSCHRSIVTERLSNEFPIKHL